MLFFFDVFPDQASSVAAEIDWVINTIHYIIFAGLLVSELILFYFLIFYRRRRNDTRKVPYIPADSMRSGIGLVVGVVGLLLVVDLFIEVATAPTWEKIKVHQLKSVDDPTRAADEEPYDLLVRVRGRQFAWDITYAGKDGFLDTSDDIVPTAEEGFRVPLNKLVRVQIESADVLHCFYVPQFRLKQDAVPGRSIPAWFKAIGDKEHAGDKDYVYEYELVCAELCGRNHSAMRFPLFVEHEEKFNAWMASK